MSLEVFLEPLFHQLPLGPGFLSQTGLPEHRGFSLIRLRLEGVSLLSLEPLEQGLSTFLRPVSPSQDGAGGGGREEEELGGEGWQLQALFCPFKLCTSLLRRS